MTDLVRTVVIDDEPDMRELLRLRFARHGSFDVVGEGCDGPDAVDLCREHRPDLLVLDALLPSGHGTEVVPDVLAASPATIVVLFTADVGLATRDAAERVGAHAVVGKLDPFDRFIGTIFRLLPEKAPPAPSPDDFGERMSALLARDEGLEPAPWWRYRGQTRFALVLVLLLVVLPLLSATVWAGAMLAGGAG